MQRRTHAQTFECVFVFILMINQCNHKFTATICVHVLEIVWCVAPIIRRTFVIISLFFDNLIASHVHKELKRNKIRTLSRTIQHCAMRATSFLWRPLVGSSPVLHLFFFLHLLSRFSLLFCFSVNCDAIICETIGCDDILDRLTHLSRRHASTRFVDNTFKAYGVAHCVV